MRYVKLPIQNKLVLIVFVLSTVVTAFSIAASFFFDYKAEHEELDHSIAYVEATHLKPLSKLLWDYNETQIQTQLKSLSEAPQIAAISLQVVDTQDILSFKNENQNKLTGSNIKKVYQIIHESSGEVLGVLSIEYDRTHIYNKLWDKAVFIILSQSLKSIVLMFILLVLFKYIVARRLTEISRFLTAFNESKFESIDRRLFSKDKTGFFHNEFDEINEISRITLKMAHKMRRYRRASAQQLAQEKAISFQASKLAALGEMSSTIAHEINNPLSVISSRTQLLKKVLLALPGGHTEVSIKSLDAIERMTERVTKIIKTLRQVSRDASDEDYSDVSPDDLFQDLQLLVFEKARKSGIQIHIEATTAGVVRCRPTQIQQILTNLINNAVDAVEFLPEKWITLTCFEKTVAGNDYLVFQVKDSGAGLSDEVSKRVMQPFFTTKPRGKGVGIGLSISKRIAQEHQGDLVVDTSTANTCFELLLPLKNEDEYSLVTQQAA
jgi:C4-dicarboxylate-specific signal transduction histidine kinase